ncbi:MAG: hypothetical protein QOF73_2566, partial [Thermomicrobiales bacterium]|nr:hypothetical protein [Thermomicrobiales bacterium]
MFRCLLAPRLILLPVIVLTTLPIALAAQEATPVTGTGAPTRLEGSGSLDANGRWSELAPLAPEGGTVQRNPIVVGRPGGGFAAVWLDGNNEEGENEPLIWAELAPDESTWTAPRRLHADARANWREEYPPVLLALSDGSLAVAWEEATEEGFRLWSSTLASGTDEWSSPEPIADSDDGKFPSLAVGADDTLYAVWQGFSRPYAPWSGLGGGTPVFSFRPRGGKWQPSRGIRTTPHRKVQVAFEGGGSRAVATGGYQPQVQVAPDDRVVVVWSDDEEALTANGREGSDLLFSIWDPQADTWTPDAPVGLDRSEAEARQPALIGTAEGVQLVVRDDDRRLAWATLQPGEDAWTTREAITEPVANASEPQLHATPAGTLALMWSVRGTGNSVGGALLTPGSDGWTKLPAAFKGRPFFSYDAAIDGRGRLAIVVEEDTKTGLAVMFSFYTPGSLGVVTSPTPRPQSTAEEPESAPVYRGNPAHTGTQPGPGPTGDFSLRWSAGYREGATSPTLADGVLYVGGRDGLHAVDPATGADIWVFRTEAAVTSAPAVGGGTVSFVDADGGISAVDAEGRLLWQVPGERVHASRGSSPAIADGIVYVGSSYSEDAVLALDAVTGEQVWRFVAVENIDSSPTVVDGVVYVGGSNEPEGDAFPGMLWAIDARTGQEIWRYKTGKDVTSTPAVYDGVVYAGANDGVLYAVDAASGALLWRFEGGPERSYSSSPAVSRGLVYYGGHGGVLYALDAGSGDVVWDADLGLASQQPVVAGGAVYAPTRRAVVVLDAETGDQLGRMEDVGGSRP